MSPTVAFDSFSVFPPLYPQHGAVLNLVLEMKELLPYRELTDVNNSFSLLKSVFPQRDSGISEFSYVL